MEKLLLAAAFLPTLALANGVPFHCDGRAAKLNELFDIPSALSLGPRGAHIAKITSLGDFPREPVGSGDSGRYFLECPVRVQWSNGALTTGYYEQWDDSQGHVVVYFGPDQYLPRDFYSF